MKTAALLYDEARAAICDPDRDPGPVFDAAAQSWAAENKMLLAAHAQEHGLVWGATTLADRERRSHAVAELLRCVAEDSSAPESERLVALHKLVAATTAHADGPQRAEAILRARAIEREFVVRLRSSTLAAEAPESALVRGAVLVLDLTDGSSNLRLPEVEVSVGGEWSTTKTEWCIPFPSTLFVETRYLSDWEAANETAIRFPNAFTTPALRGWREAVAAFSSDRGRADRFSAAANHFDSDTKDAPSPRVGGWDSASTHLWGPYFRSREYLARVIDEPSNAEQLIELAVHKADSLDNVPWIRSHVVRYLVLLHVLRAMVRREPPPVDRLRRAVGVCALVSRTDALDSRILELVTACADAMTSMQRDPAVTLLFGELRSVLDSLDRLPFFEPGIVAAASSVLSDRLYWGPKRAWLHEALEGLETEADLRRVLYKALQAQRPKLVEHSHGPLEYGKDLICVSLDDRLTMFQAKLGDIGKREWPKCRQQLEEMFLVNPLSVRAPADPPVRRGVLVCNGHAKPTVAPLIRGWIAEQRRRGWIIEFWDLDALVQWIVAHDLEGAVREAILRTARAR